MKKYNIILCGAFGRVSKKFIIFLKNKFNFFVIAYVSSKVKNKSNKEKIFYYNNLNEAILDNINLDFAILDFSHFSNVIYNLRVAFFYKKPIIFIQSEIEKYKKIFKFYSKFIPILVVFNSSFGANLFLDICSFISDNLPNNEAMCYEIHHKEKKEIFSSTLKELVKKKNINPLNISSFRISNILGIHSFYLFNKHEEINIFHKVIDFSSFGDGFLNSIIFIYYKKQGFFNFKDIYLFMNYYV